MEEEDFRYDVFLSHSWKDKAVVRDIAERLRKDGLRVWLDEWELKPGDSIPSRIEDGLRHSRVLVLCMSANAFGPDWDRLESYTFRFRDPLNKDRRFIPIRLDDATIEGSLSQFLYIDWLPSAREESYPKLLEACRPATTARPASEIVERSFQLDSKSGVMAYAFGPDGKRVFTGGDDGEARLWDVETGRCVRVFGGDGSGESAG